MSGTILTGACDAGRDHPGAAAGATVYVLGGNAALSPSVIAAFSRARFHPLRLSGPNRFATAVAIADAIGPKAIFVATGVNFADALSAGPCRADAARRCSW